MTNAPILLDADGMILTSIQAATSVTEWTGWISSLHVDIPMAKDNIKAQIDKYQEVLGSNRPLVFCLSDSSRKYFRHELYPQYKASRVSGPKIGLGTLREWLIDQGQTREISGLEGDDVMGILATEYMRDNPEGPLPTIVSVDKDMQQIPCEHLNSAYPDKGTWTTTSETAYKFWWTQVLVGDSVDGYPGCKGVGPVRAERLLATSENYPQTAAHAYVKAGHTKEFFESMVNVSRILTIDCWNKPKSKPVLWTSANVDWNGVND